MTHMTSSFNAVLDTYGEGNLQNDTFSRTISVLSRGSLLQKNRHSFKAALREVSLIHPPVKDAGMSGENDFLSIKTKIHAKKSNNHLKTHRTGMCAGRDKDTAVTSPPLQSAPLYLGENDAKILGSTRVAKPIAKKTSISSQTNSVSLLMKNTLRENDEIASGPNPTTYRPYPDSWVKKPQRGPSIVPFLSTIQGKKKRRKTFSNSASHNLPSAHVSQILSQKKDDNRTAVRRGSCPDTINDLVSLRISSPSYLSNQNRKEKQYEMISINRGGNTESSMALISSNSIGEDNCDDSISSVSVKPSEDVNDGIIELSQICHVNDTISDSISHYDRIHTVESDSKNYSKDHRSERWKLYDNRIPQKSPIARKLSYSGGCMLGSTSNSIDMSDQFPSVETDGLSRISRGKSSQGILQYIELTDRLNLVGTAVGQGLSSLRPSRSCASPASQRRARTYQLSVLTSHTAIDMDTDGDDVDVCAEIGQSDSWYEGSLSSINVVFSPPKPVLKSSPGAKIEVENEGSASNRRYETADNDLGKNYFPLVSSISMVSESDPRSLLSSADFSSGSHSQGTISDIYLTGYSPRFSTSGREDNIELPGFIDTKQQIGYLIPEPIQPNHIKLSRALTDKTEEKKIDVCDKIPTVTVRRINYPRIGDKDGNFKWTISRKNRIEILGSHILNNSNFLRPVSRHSSIKAPAHMTSLSDKVLKKTLHLINHEVVFKV